ncbi:MAG: CoA pyrophosphatase [Betaproteobacteria bacterium]|jgi:8-oxo-dGTP pyrophosphatase MutT (NUDIX family)
MISTGIPAPTLDTRWVRERLARAPAPRPGDLPLFRHPDHVTPVAAAVLVPLVWREAEVRVLLTQRTAHLNDHAGQISFPGGRVDEGDVDRVHTALREAEEEIGLPRGCVEILGTLPDYDIMTGFRVTPVVGWIPQPFGVRTDAFEVAEVFEVPLAFLLDPANHQRHSRVVGGTTRHYYAMPWQGRHIWGATAGMLHHLYRALGNA